MPAWVRWPETDSAWNRRSRPPACVAGPSYNKPWEAFDDDDARSSLATAFEAVARARKLSASTTETEQALIRARRCRYPSADPADDMCPWNDDTLGRACHHPDNVWSLHGYHECLERLGRHAEAAIVKQKPQIAAARTDVPVTASCFCRLHGRQGMRSPQPSQETCPEHGQPAVAAAASTGVAPRTCRALQAP